MRAPDSFFLELFFYCLIHRKLVLGHKNAAHSGYSEGLGSSGCSVPAEKIIALLLLGRGDNIGFHGKSVLLCGGGVGESKDLVLLQSGFYNLIGILEDNCLSLTPWNRKIGSEHILKILGKRRIPQHVKFDNSDDLIGFTADSKGDGAGLLTLEAVVLDIGADDLVRQLPGIPVGDVCDIRQILDDIVKEPLAVSGVLLEEIDDKGLQKGVEVHGFILFGEFKELSVVN